MIRVFTDCERFYFDLLRAAAGKHIVRVSAVAEGFWGALFGWWVS